MRPIVIVLIVVALGAAGLTAFLALRFLNSVQQPQPAPEAVVGGVEDVLVAGRDIQPGEVLTDADLRWEPWPKAVLDVRFVVKSAAGEDPLAKFRDTMTRRAIMVGEPMTETSIIKRGDAGVTSAVLQPGMRSVTVKVTPESGAAGLILPGDHVDVMLLGNLRDVAGVPETVGRETLSRYAAEAILRDVKVIAVNQLLAKEPESGPGIASQTVTLEVTAEQSQKILVASQLGEVFLSLRGWARNDEAKQADLVAPVFVTDRDTSKVLDNLMRGSLVAEMFAMPAAEGEETTVVDQPVRAVRSIRINRGGAVTVQSLGQ